MGASRSAPTPDACRLIQRFAERTASERIGSQDLVGDSVFVWHALHQLYAGYLEAKCGRRGVWAFEFCLAAFRPAEGKVG